MTRLHACRGGCGQLVATASGRCSACDRRRTALECVMDGCRTSRYQRSRFCSTHKMRAHRYGSPAEPSHQRVAPACIEVGCSAKRRPYTSRCAEHWRAWARTRPLPGGPVTYRAAHARVRSRRGPATQHVCMSCGGRAQHWAYDHRDPAELTSPEGPYSADLARYRPLCVPCHKREDLAHLRRAPAPSTAGPLRVSDRLAAIFERDEVTR